MDWVNKLFYKLVDLLIATRKAKSWPGTFLGKHHSKESKQKLSEKAKLLHWFNDGVKNYRCKECPPGCVKGRIGWHEKVEAQKKISTTLYIN